MPDKRITDLPVGSPLTGTEAFLMTQGGVSKQTSPNEVRNFTSLKIQFNSILIDSAYFLNFTNKFTILNSGHNFTIDIDLSGKEDSLPVSSDSSYFLSANKTWQPVTKNTVGLNNLTNDAQIKLDDLDTDPTLAANSDTKVASQKATKSYIDNHNWDGGTF